MIANRIELDENDLRFHSEMRVFVHGNETVWIGDISGDDRDTAMVTLNFKNVSLGGSFTDLLGRLKAAVSLLERAQTTQDDWDLLLPRYRRAGNLGPRSWPHPYMDRPSQRVD